MSNIIHKRLLSIIFFIIVNCGFIPTKSLELKTKLVVYCVLSNFYECQFVFVDTITHINASEYKEFGKPVHLYSDVPGIRDAEVIITYNGESKILSGLTKSIAEYHRIYLPFLQGYYCDYFDKIDIYPGGRYILTVKYKDMEVSSETRMPEEFKKINIDLKDSLHISWEQNSDIHYYRYRLFKYYSNEPNMTGFYDYLGESISDETGNSFLSYDINYIENYFKSYKYYSDDITGRYIIMFGSYDKNLYEYRMNMTTNINGGFGLFGSIYIAEKEFEIVKNNGKYEVKVK